MTDGERRRHPRISWGFLVKHKLQGQNQDAVDLSTVKNISLGGCYFGSRKAYSAGQVLDLEVKLPGIKDPLLFQGKVQRCDPGQAPGLFFIAVEFMDMGESQKEEFSRVMSFFIKKQNRRDRTP